MSHTPQQSPASLSTSQSQEDINTYEVIDQPMHDEEENELLHEEMTPPETQIKAQLESQGPTRNQEMDVDEPVSIPTPASPLGPSAEQHRRQTRTPEPQQRNSQRVMVQPSPSSPGRIEPFDWEGFESRYQKALTEADEKESELLAEFEDLVKYFNVWASASSIHDNERAVKRLQTRTRYVHLSENKLKQKKEHLSEVVKAFQSALALLSAAR